MTPSQRLQAEVTAKMDKLKKLQGEINELKEREEREILFPKLKSLIGRVFRYRNCYSCPKNESDYWWAYRKLINVTEKDHVEYFEIEIDRDGKLSAGTYRTSWYGASRIFFDGNDGRGWERAAQKDYKALLRRARLVLEVA